MSIKLNRKGAGLAGEDRVKENQNLELIEQEFGRLGVAKEDSAAAKLSALEALAKANAADSLSKNVQTQLSTLVVEGDSSPQATQASVGADGMEYGGSLKARLDAEQNETMAQLADIAVNVKSFGAIGDGVVDDTNAINQAIQSGNKILFPEGVYRIPKGKQINLISNKEVYGIRGKSIIQKEESAGVADHAFSIQSPYTTPADSLRGISIHDLTIKGSVAVFPFVEPAHLIAVRGVDGLDIYNCDIIGFQGDGICLGVEDGQHPDGVEHRRNSNVKIYDNFIDGVNKDNRNGISVVSGDNVKIFNNTVVRTTRFNMPGAIDIEPNPYPVYTIRNIEVFGNTIEDIGGNVAAITVYCPEETKPSNIRIRNNTIRKVYSFFRVMTFDEDSSGAVVVEGNICDDSSYIGAFYQGVIHKPHFKDNTMTGIRHIGLALGFDASVDLTMKDGFIENNTIQTTGNFPVIRVRSLENVKVEKNTLIGDTTSTFIQVGSSASVNKGFQFNGNTLFMKNQPTYIVTTTGEVDLLTNTFNENTMNFELDAADTLFALNKSKNMQGSLNKLDGNSPLASFPTGKSFIAVNSGANMPITGTGLLETVKVEARSQTAYRSISHQLFKGRGQMAQFVRFWDNATSNWTSWTRTPRITAIPSTSTSSGFTGDMAVDSNYLYICYGTNLWKRVTLSAW